MALDIVSCPEPGVRTFTNFSQLLYRVIPADVARIGHGNPRVDRRRCRLVGRDTRSRAAHSAGCESRARGKRPGSLEPRRKAADLRYHHGPAYAGHGWLRVNRAGASDARGAAIPIIVVSAD